MRFIGNKTNLLKNIQDLLEPHLTGEETTFVDLFAGSNSVGKYFKHQYKVISNDLMYFSYVIARASIQLNKVPEFAGLKDLGIEDPFKYFQSIDLESYDGEFVTEQYSPAGKAKRMYLTVENAKRIDFIRNKIAEWYRNELISEDEQYYLLDSLIQAIPYVSNITGTYGAYLKSWDKRAYKPLELIPGLIKDNGQDNQALNEDAVKLSKNLSGDILYIDTPYNNRQYAPNYHVLETIARNDKPELKGITGQRVESVAKSDFSIIKKAEASMELLLQDLNFYHVVVSYSTDGIISEKKLIDMIKKVSLNGEFEEVRIPFRKYKSKIVKPGNELYELLFYFQPENIALQKNNKHYENVIPKIKTATSSSLGYIKSPLNYIGGKYKLLPQIIPFFPKHSDTFVDLFSGGGNVGINISADKVYFNDMNNKVNDLFRFFQDADPYDLIAQIHKRINDYQLSKTNEQGFLKFREQYNNNPTPLDLYVLVSYSFNYQFRFNNNMEYNNPFGRNRSQFSARMENNLIRFINRLNTLDAVFTDYYFTQFDMGNLTKNSFVYADPPYLITTGSYNDGNRGFVNWTEKQEHELYELLDVLDKRQIKFALSNVTEHKGKKNDILMNWIDKNGYVQHNLNYNYNNSSYNTKKDTSIEVLVTNY
ncbi:Dam family site-specific DNA-(adenine-N6)-methyltransferase [Lactiplantibacillus plantarum]|uniref:Dam family site-specific DNA-(adenine-N6)-methyltransferase n=1 Tax=Lactiplantibacillus plantarum TaxID=1590 RepID=UPI00223849C9|nr:Dam family site-specific DNA-(adenine-N6)-methyltransferase [Lactiplantibacillus plantarum]MCW6134542.1 Dam family site-specific DNA-(adenine-N6)-methyltransferase [Lactiplantibacillus plantarum]